MEDKNAPQSVKNIILCSDGTGQSGGVGRNTNVWRVYDAIDIHSKKAKQLAFYDDGVGTNKNMLSKIIGLAFGWGLSKNIRQIYKYAVLHYSPADRLYLFGFSRGSHTIRLLTELICSFGIINPIHFDNEQQLDKAIKIIQKEFKRAIRDAWVAKIFSTGLDNSQESFRAITRDIIEKRKQKCTRKLGSLIKKQTLNREIEKSHSQVLYDEVEIEFLGVWDTVSAVGMPIEEMRDSYFFAWHAFVDNKLSRKVKRACHALAIDEKRHTFKPELWDQSSDDDQKRIEQVWFSGVHANVGGGYPKDSLSFVSLEWMMSEAIKKQLFFRKSRLKEIRRTANHNGTLYDSRKGLASLYRYKPRNIDELTKQIYQASSKKAKKKQSAPVVKPKIHYSVFQRVAESQLEYSPTNLSLESEIVYKGAKEISKEVKLKNGYVDEIDDNKTILHDIQIETEQTRLKIDDEHKNIIWLEKRLHFLFIAYFILFAYVGYYLTKLTAEIKIDDSNKFLEVVSKTFKLINDMNPLYITNKILPGYANNSGIFIIMLLIFPVLYWVGKYLKKHRQNIGNIYWSKTGLQQSQIELKRLFVNPFAKLWFNIAAFFRRKATDNQKLILSFKKIVLPIVMTLALIWLTIMIPSYIYASYYGAN